MFCSLKKHLRNLFVPHQSNNYRAKILQHDTLTYIMGVFLVVALVFRTSGTSSFHHVLGASLHIQTQTLLEDTNKERVDRGLKPLSLNKTLSEAAADKANDMFAHNYWNHYSPTGTSPWYFFNKHEYQYTFAGENLAKDFTDSANVVQAWMQSAKHRENILRPEYTEIGFAIEEGVLQGKPTVLVVQLLATPDPTYRAPATQLIDKESNVLPAHQQLPAISHQPLINTASWGRSTIIVMLAVLICSLSIDMYIFERRKLYRSTGKSTVHILFLFIVIIGIIVINTGTII